MKIEMVSKKINGRQILSDINFTTNTNEIIGLIGRNGSGKTSLFRTLAGHYLVDSGEVLIEGKNIFIHPELKTHIFYIDEQINFFSTYSLKKIGKFYQTAYPNFDGKQFSELMKSNNLPINKSFRTISKGMQGLFKIVLAICSNAPYILLDEPFDGLDVIVKKNVIRLLLESLSDGDRTVIISSHNLNELEGIIDRALIIKDATIKLDYQLEEMRAQARKVQMVFRTKKVPPFIKENCKLLRIQGRVIIAIFENYTEEVEQKIREVDPVLFEELPLTLEDLFEANLSQESDYQLFN
ncbi:multidrug ABC transporter [Enterococcus sp. JM4C]|uniref:ATP-binding cassette domain-containing protein n=1 Tax=Candidatus Enterococcus huntleyi TaxID=1857217 RepID=UPI00137961C2|nr:ABC transporter ATP-binding protein [Enterococcus sp. JM4C]KAF1297568.1 multidrug ABC transporter [Enterococcus sp. JM4C]